MTVIVSVQCSEGIVLAADSAVSIYSENNTFVWPHAKKLSHIKDLNIGALSFGLGAIGQRNIQSLMYEFEISRNAGCKEGQDGYSVKEVTECLFDFLQEKYKEEYGNTTINGLGLGTIVAGYSKGSFTPEQYRFVIPMSHKPKPIKFDNGVGLVYDGLPDTIYRLLYGIDNTVALALSKVSFTREQRILLAEGLDKPRGPSREVIDKFIEDIKEGTDEIDRFISWNNLVSINPIVPGMPLQDGIDLAIWLIDATIGRYRFGNPIPLVGAPIDIAVITHKNYTWIQRKSWHGYQNKPLYLKIGSSKT
jgi:hypothetical protein